MKRGIIFFFLSLITVSAFCQCNTDVSICDPGVAGPFTFVPASEEVGTCQSFINGIASPNYGFILLYITESGPLSLLIEGNVNNGFIDVSIFNIPSGEDPCEAITNTDNELGCNFAFLDEGCNEFGTFFGCSSQVESPFVNAGDIIMIVIEDYSDTQTNFTLDLGPPPNAQTGALDATINPIPTELTSTDDPYGMTAEVGGGTWTADCGPCIDPNTGDFDPTVSGIGIFEVCYEIGEAPCDNIDCLTVEVICGSSAEIIGDINICEGDSGILQIVFEGDAPFVFDYSVDGILQGEIMTSDNPYNLEVDQAGDYEILSFYDAICAGEISGLSTVTFNEGPEIINLLEECDDNGLTYIVSFEIIGGDPSSYVVSGDGDLSGNIFVSDEIAGGDPYSFDVTDGNQCSINTISGLVICTCPVSAEISGNTFYCPNSLDETLTIDLTGESPWTFNYSIDGIDQGTITTSDNPYFLNVDSPGEYVISSISDATCDGEPSNPFTINSFELPTATLGGFEDICVGESSIITVDFTGQGPWEYELAIDGVGQGIQTNSESTIDIDVSETGVYTILTVSDLNCSNSGSGFATLTIHELPEALVAGDLILCEESSAVIAIEVSGNPNFELGYTLDGIIQPPLTINESGTYDLEISESGIYELISIQDAFCQGFAGGIVQVNSQPLPSAEIIGDFTICEGDEENLIINLTGNPDWLINYSIDGLTQTSISTSDNSYELLANQEGEYEIISVSDMYCSGEGIGVASIEFYPPIEIDFDSGEGVCIGEEIQIEANASGGIGLPYNYLWTGEDMTVISAQMVTVFSNESGSINLSVGDDCGYNTVVEIPYTIHQLPPISISGNQSMCGSGNATFFNATPLSYVGDNCQWIVQGDSASSNCNSQEYFLGDVGVYDIELMVTSPQGCTNQVLFENYFEVFSQPISTFSFLPESPTVSTPSVEFINESTIDAVDFEWSIGDIAYFQDQDFIFDLPIENGPDSWQVCLEVFSENGCSDLSCLPLIMEPDLLLHTPNTFTPDGDGLNEMFSPYIEGMNSDYYDFQIFDRYGKKVFESNDVTEKWNGSYMNKDDSFTMDGIYNWQLKVRLEGSTEDRLIQGWVNVLR